VLSCHQLTPALVYRAELARHLLLLLPLAFLPSPGVGGGHGAVHVPCVVQAGHSQHLSPLTLAGAVEESERQKIRSEGLF